MKGNYKWVSGTSAVRQSRRYRSARYGILKPQRAAARKTR